MSGVCVVGAALADIGVPRLDGFGTGVSIAAQATHRALADAGLGIDRVDGLFCCGFGETSTYELADYLGLRDLSFVDGTCVGGASWVTYVEHAMAALEAGRCDVAVIAHGALAYTDRKRHAPIWPDQRTLLNQFDQALGGGFIAAHALAAQRYLHDHGLAAGALAEVAVAARRWSALNPLARFRDPLTVAEVRAARPIASPFTMLDCCLISDGGGAVVLMRSEDCRGAARAVPVLGVGSGQGEFMIAQHADLCLTPSVESGRQAFEMAGVGAEDIDHLMLYDSFTITPVLALEDLGFAERGAGTQLVASGATSPGGARPMNTNGGGLAFAHTGMYGVFTLIEAVTQLRAEAGARQVDCRISLAHAVGDFLTATGTCILGVPR